MLLQVSYLVLMLLPTVSRFMSEEVMVMVSYLPKTRAGERSLIDAPAVTFCPQNQSEYKYQTVSVLLCQQDNCNSSSGWRLPAHENIRTFCNDENMEGKTSPPLPLL